jgi:hypothetical protein
MRAHASPAARPEPRKTSVITGSGYSRSRTCRDVNYFDKVLDEFSARQIFGTQPDHTESEHGALAMPCKDILEMTGGLPVPQPAHERRSATAPPQEDLIGRQAMEIIDGMLAPDSECDEKIRQGLRRHMAARPGRPEPALLEHVLAVRGGTRPSLPVNLQRQSL